MAAARRMGTETSETRFLLLDVTERVMIEDGYAAVSSRRVAKDAGVTAALVHYYFATLDDLFLAVLRRRAEQQLERHERFLSSPQPLRALWSFSSEQAGTVLLMEFMALSNHRKSIRKELADYAERFRKFQLEALSSRLEEYGLDPAEVPPEAVLVLIAGISRTVVMEKALGMRTGLPETVALVERYLDRFEGPKEPAPRKRAGTPRVRRSSAASSTGRQWGRASRRRRWSRPDHGAGLADSMADSHRHLRLRLTPPQSPVIRGPSACRRARSRPGNDGGELDIPDPPRRAPGSPSSARA